MSPASLLKVILAAALLAPSPALAAELEVAPAAPGGPVVAPISERAPVVDLNVPDLSALTPLGDVSLPQNAASALPDAAALSAAGPQLTATPATAAASAVAATAKTASPATALARGAFSSLSATLAPAHANATPIGERLDALYDDAAPARSDDVDASPVAAQDSAPISKPRFSFAPRVARHRAVRLLPALAVAALLFATPAIAAAAPAAGFLTQSGSLSILSAIHPIASAVGAVVGAAFGLFAARSKDGSEVPAGHVLASVLRYGVIGGAGVYGLLDLTQLVFVGPSVGLTPLSAAVATAALGRSAFQGKFADPATTPADRVIGAFPAVAAAVGLSIGVSILSVDLAYRVATAAMAATGVATALYAAIFNPARSPADGPKRLGEGYVLQALMSGLALALTGWLVWPFSILGVAGFALVLYAVVRELLSLIPKKKPQA